jgi:hypothetical protein
MGTLICKSPESDVREAQHDARVAALLIGLLSPNARGEILSAIRTRLALEAHEARYRQFAPGTERPQ